jgi:hypothetical protein
MPKIKHKTRVTMRESVHIQTTKRTRRTSRSNSGCSSEDETTNHDLDGAINHRQKRPRIDASNAVMFDPLTPSLKLKDPTRIYNFGYRKKPAELFRKDLISAMKMADSEQLNESDYITITDHWKEEWEKGVQVPVNPDGLPSASFRPLTKVRQKTPPTSSSSVSPVKLEPESQENGNKKQYKNTAQMKLPKEYIKRTHRSNEFLKYELDLIDICWLKLMNQTCLPKIPEALIEDVITELERQCAENMKNNKIGIEFNDGVVCDVCRSPYSEDGNEMIFCDTCNVCVHQACYDIDEIPAGDWYCQPCRELGRVDKACCVLCPNKNGAMKRTPDNYWAHVSCALWVVSQIDGDHKDNALDVKSTKKNKSNKT